MTWLEILWSCFWRSLLWRQHERHHPPATMPARLSLPARCRAAWKETTDKVRHSGLERACFICYAAAQLPEEKK